MANIPFASSNGGPVVAVPAEVAAHWLGLGDDAFHAEYLARSSKMRSTEYGGFFTMKLAGSTVLLFNGETHTSWLQEPGGGTFVREGCPHTAAKARKLVASVPEKAWKRFTMLTLKEGRLVVLDSALPAGDLSAIDTSNGVVRAKLEPGAYQVDIAALGGIDLARLRLTATAVAKPAKPAKPKPAKPKAGATERRR